MGNSKPSAKTSNRKPVDAPNVDGDPIGQKYFYAGAILAFLASFVIYAKTMGPSSAFWDAGEFIATSYTLGIPHSPGTPLYVLMGRVFTLLPLPFSIAGKVNFISVFVGGLGVVFVYLLTVRFLDFMLGKSATLGDTIVKVSGALVGALFLAYSGTYWTNATEAEVYALSSFFMGFMTWLALKWEENPLGVKATSFIYLLFYLLALSVGFHLGTILAFSGVFFVILMTQNKTFTNAQFILACIGMAIFIADATLYRFGGLTLVFLGLFIVALVFTSGKSKNNFALICTVLFVLGLSVHLYMIIRSGHNPLIDEGDPETWRSLYAALRREQYPPPNVLARKASFVFQLQHFNDYFQRQFQMASMFVGKINIGSVIPIGLGIWGMVDHYTKHRKSFIMLFVTYIVVSLGLIVYLNFSDSEVRERDYFYSPAFYYFAVFIGIGAASLLNEIKGFASRQGLNAMAAVAIPSILLLAMPVFTARHNYFTHDRSNNYICREYAKNMLVGLEENALLFTNGDNDTFPLWFIQEVEGYRTDIRVVNLSLLNTPWYIKQLRDNEPKVNITWTDEELLRLTPIRTEDGWILIRDIGVQKIVRDNNKSRPIYFAVTIPPNIYAPYRSFMEMEGLAYRLVPRKGENMVNVAKLEDNVWNKFSYLGILDDNWQRDDSVHRQPFVRRLIQNYAAAFTQLGFMNARDKDYANAIKNLEVAQQIAPDLDPVLVWMGWYYLENGDTSRAIQFYEEQIARRPDRPDLFYRLAGVYERIGDLQSALGALEELIRRDSGHRDAVFSAVGICMQFGMHDRAESLLRNWLATHPNDPNAKQALDELLRVPPETEGQK